MAVFFKSAASPFNSAGYYCHRARLSESENVHELGQGFDILKNF